MNKTSFLLVIAFIALVSASSFAQGGGKAEPGRVKFAKGKSQTVLTGTLSGDQEQEFVFGAKRARPSISPTPIRSVSLIVSLTTK
ncbi:MAG: hypothetical protein IPP63_07750 [Chloracidobacterium sp.]|nr:hypothetical protein [Chloracidobacterium sp.]